MTKYNPNDIESANFILYKNKKIKERECVREKERDVIVGTRFGLNPKTGVDPGPQSPYNKFVEYRIKSWSESRTKILGYNVKKKELYISISTKSILGYGPMLFFRIFFQSPLLSPSFILYTMDSLPFSPSTCGLGVSCPFSPSLLPFLESSILSWKVTRLLFRYHLHINAARRLVGRHLMRR